MSFLGLSNYYKKFIKNYSHIAQPLHELIGKSEDEKPRKNATLPKSPRIPFKWDKIHQEAFDELKRQLVSDCVLSLPDFSKPFILDPDDCDSSIGAALFQVVTTEIDGIVTKE
jgi:hypothetical protein